MLPCCLHLFFSWISVDREVSSRVSLLSMRSAMVRAQSEHRPNIPHSFENLAEVLQNNAELSRTLDGLEEFYQGITGVEGHRSIVFVSRRVVFGAGEIRHVFGDGTFYALPNSPHSAQPYTLITAPAQRAGKAHRQARGAGRERSVGRPDVPDGLSEASETICTNVVEPSNDEFGPIRLNPSEPELSVLDDF